MKNLHIFKNINEIFSEPYIEFINKNFNDSEHFFYHIGQDKRTNKVRRKNIAFVTKLKYFELMKDMYKAEKIFLHGLSSPPIVIILFIQPWLLKKCNWCVWGGDLYYYKYRKKSFKSDVYERLRKFVIKNMGGLITHVKGDYELAQKWYGAKGKYYYSFMYPSNLYKEYDLSKAKRDYGKTYIKVGNSADPSNNYLEVLKKLERYKDKDIEIICPLSYGNPGNPEYRDLVISEGKKIFGDKFIPLTEFLSFKEYLALLAKVDIAIFNHHRQQAMGSITTLLGLGKKVYIRDDITTWDFCLDHGLKVFSSNGDFDDLFEEMDEDIRLKNIENIRNKFSEEKLKNDWSKIF